jgi:hypothetical protein
VDRIGRAVVKDAKGAREARGARGARGAKEIKDGRVDIYTNKAQGARNAKNTNV